MKNFNYIYEVLYKKHNNRLEKIRKEILNKNIKIICVIIILVLILVGITGKVIFILLGLIAIILKLAFNSKAKEYRTIFKEDIIKTLINEYDNNLSFNAERGIASIIYNKGEFEKYDIFRSEDLITGSLEGKYKIQMAEVHTQDEQTDSEGDKHYVTLFHGLFAQIELDQIIFAKLKLRKDKLKLFFEDNERVELDSSEFEKMYDVYSTDKIIAMQLLTSDTMQMFIDFKEKYKIIPELTLKEDKLYIRFQTGNLFEANIMKNSLDYETLLKYYNTINFTLDITKEFIKNIKEAEI